LLGKIIVILLFPAILYALGSSFVFLVKDGGEGDRMVRRLSWRVGLSIGMILLLWLGYQLGWVEPQGLATAVPPAAG